MAAAASGRGALVDHVQFPLELIGPVKHPVPLGVAKLSAVRTAQLAALSECSFLRPLLAVDRS